MGTPARPITGIPRALTIAGSDSGGGAGIQADLKVFLALGCHGMSAVTALTAQNTTGVSGIHEVPPSFVASQIDAVVPDIGVDAAKTGMLASAGIVEVVAESVEAHGIANLVVDPVFMAQSGDRLLSEDAIQTMKERLFPLATVLTPNLLEAEGLVGHRLDGDDDLRAAADELFRMGARTIVIKGGHIDGERAVDHFYDGGRFIAIDGPRFDTDDTHGTGCALSAAIAARLAHGDDELSAVRHAKEFVAGAIERSLRLGKGYGPVNPGWRLAARSTSAANSSGPSPSARARRSR